MEPAVIVFALHMPTFSQFANQHSSERQELLGCGTETMEQFTRSFAGRLNGDETVKIRRLSENRIRVRGATKMYQSTQ